MLEGLCEGLARRLGLGPSLWLWEEKRLLALDRMSGIPAAGSAFPKL